MSRVFLAFVIGVLLVCGAPASHAASSAGSELRRFQDEELRRTMLEKVEEDPEQDEELITYQDPEEASRKRSKRPAQE